MLNTFQSSLRCLRRSNLLRLQNIELTIKKQNITGWVHRQPSKIVNEEIALDNAEEATKPVRRRYLSEDPEHRPMRAKKKHSPPNKVAPKILNDATFNEDGTPNVIRFQDDDRKLSAMVIGLKSRKAREKRKQILLEGHRLIQDAIKAGLVPEIIMFSRNMEFEKLTLPPKGVKLYKVPYSTLQLWSNLTTSPGIVGIFKYPESFEKESTKETLPLTIICDNVREPGNLGTILRAAAGVGCERIILTKGCVDVWESKVLRSAAGAHFRVSISKSVEWDDVTSLISPNASIFVADNDMAHDTEETSHSSTAEVPLDSEENSSAEILADSAESDSKHRSNDENSVNSAEFESKNDCGGGNSGESAQSESTETTIEGSENPSSIRKVTVRELSNRIPVIPYYAAGYADNEVVLIVGGETEGLSYESIKLVQERNGVRVNIPLTNGVDSLNTGMALGIVAFEIKRQFALRKDSMKE